MSMLDHAEILVAAGISCIPTVDGSKKAACEWKPFQHHVPDATELMKMFRDGTGGIAAICGPVSGGLELIDFDVPDKPEGRIPPAWKPFCELLKEHGYSELLKRLLIVETPSGGRHLVYRCPAVSEGNQKLAETEDHKPLIETRGNGGYFLVPPSAGYVLKQGSFVNVPILSESERETLHVCARLQNQRIERVDHTRNYPAAKRPGDDYQLRGESMEQLLMRHGWRPVQGRAGAWANFTRPDKQEGVSGGISQSTGLFHVFTTSTPFDALKGYNKFSCYCVLEHGGDFIAAAKELAGLGYGEKGGMPREEPKAKQYPGTVALSKSEEEELWGTGDEFDEIAIEWFWEERIPLAALTMIQGDPGIGKSTITMAIAACASVGGILPGGCRLPECHVVMLACEDDPARVVVPRMKAMGANVRNISLIATDRKRADGTPLFDGTITLEMLFNRVRKMGAKLLIIDPLIESLAALGIDPCKSQEVRPFMAQMRVAAELHNCSVVLVHHQNKNAGGKSLYRSVGSIDIPAACRSVFAVGSDPNNPELKAMAHVKSNWAALQPTLGYTVKDGMFGWTGESSLTAEDLSQPPMLREEREKQGSCKEWLKEFLGGGAVDAVLVRQVAKEHGYGRRQLDGAKDSLHVELKRITFGNKGEGGWKWQLPGQPEEDPFEQP